MIQIVQEERLVVAEGGYGLVEGDAVLSEVVPGFARIPFETGHIVTYIRRMYLSRAICTA
jgi:hypothetical protein